MNTNNFWGKSRSAGVNVGLVVRLLLATIFLVGSLALAMTLLGPQRGVQASASLHVLQKTATSTPSPTGTPPPPALGPGPVHQTWYFAEGKVGQDAYRAAIQEGYFDLVELSYGYDAPTAVFISQLLTASHHYELLGKIPNSNSYGAGYFWIWRKM